MQLAVLNPGGNDPTQRFPDGAGLPDPKVHAPVNYHAFAACTRGTFYRKESEIPKDQKDVLVLVRKDLKACARAVYELRRTGRNVVLALKEAGSHQVAALLSSRGRLQLFQEMCARAYGAIATTPDLVPLLRACGARNCEFIPTPYPVEVSEWDFSTRLEEREGIFLGTREFDVPSRNHLAALLAIRPVAEAMGQAVTVFNTGGWTGRRLITQLRYPDGLLRVVENRISYPAYLKLMARHRVVFQLDSSAVPGQVAGDALLCRIPCVGGNGTTERLVFPEICGHGRTIEQLTDIAVRLLDHPHDCETVMEQALENAKHTLSYTTVARQLEGFFGQFAR